MPHTPGPWRVTEWPGVSGDTHFGIDAQKWRLAIVHSGNADDATLMAAAPEMLRELKHLLSLWEEAIGYEKDYMDMADVTREVIAKAEGRE